MITEEQLRELYDNEIGITLKEMEGKRLFIKWGIVAVLVVFASIVITNITYNPPMFVFIISGVVWFSFAALVAFKAQNYTQQYKKEIVGKIINTIKPDWSYDPEKTIK